MFNLENPISKFYQLNNTILEHVDSATYLGILLHKSLHFSDHITITANKCNSRLGFIRRNVRKCPTQLKQKAYFSLIRSTAEYAATIWDTSYHADGHTRRTHWHKFREKRARTDDCKFSFTNHTIPEWNKLPAELAEAGSLNIFKGRLTAHLD